MPLIQIKNEFLTSLNECITLYRHCLSPVGVHSDSGVEAAFLQMHNSWEIFLEETLISLLCGEVVISGQGITPKFTLTDRNLARDILYQEKPFIDWTRDEKVKERFERHLNSPNRIISTLDTITLNFRDIIKVRNFIVHSSSQAKAQFINLYKGRIGGNPNTSRASFYLKELDRDNPPNTLFDRYYLTLQYAATSMLG